MKKTTALLFILVLAGWKAQAQTTAEKIKAVENNLGGWVKIADSAGWKISDRMAYYHINGVSIAVIDNYKIVWAKGYGWADTTEKRPVTTATLFQPASVGKSVHAVATMTLVQQGKLSLDKGINYYLKTWKFPYDTVSHGKKITALQLLSHTAGLSVHGFDGYRWDARLPNIIQILNGQPPANNPPVRSIFEPGKRFEYSGGGYTISGLMDQDITGIKYADWISQTVFQPLEMTNTFYNSKLPNRLRKNLATGYRCDQQAIGCKYHIYPEEACGAGLWSTPTDLARFIIELQLSAAGKSNKILSKTSVQQLFTPQTAESNNGLGFFIEKRGDELYFHHDGQNEGFVADYFGSMKGGKGVVIMANTDLAAYIDITEEITNSVATVYGWKGFYAPVVKREVKVADSVLNQYPGRYRFNDQSDQHVDIFWKNGKLWFHDSSSLQPWLMHFTNDTDFFFNEVLFNIHSFTRDKNGKVDGFMIKASDGEFKVKKVA